MRYLHIIPAMLCLSAAAGSQTLPTVKRPSARAGIDYQQIADSAQRIVAAVGRNEQLFATLGMGRLDTVGERLTGAAKDSARVRSVFQHLVDKFVSHDATWCNDPNAIIQWCALQMDTSVGHIASKKFWDQADAGGFTAVKMLNIQGLGEKQSQSVYTELVSDLWNSWRVGIGGVFGGADTSAAGKTAADKSKAQQFLNGGGPAVVTLARPIVVVNLGGTRTVGLFKAQSAFTAPGTDSQLSDSTKYSDLGLDLQSQVDGSLGKIGGIATFHAGRVFGGRPFYQGFGTTGSFTAANFSLGLLIENSVRVSWTKLFLGPSKLIDQKDLITVNVVR